MFSWEASSALVTGCVVGEVVISTMSRIDDRAEAEETIARDPLSAPDENRI
jgi:Fe2+ transport system protein B